MPNQLEVPSQLQSFSGELAFDRKISLYCEDEEVWVRSLVPKEKSHLQTYLIQRVKLPPLEISKETYGAICQAMDNGKKHLMIGDSLVMLNTITAIDPAPLRKKHWGVTYRDGRKEWEDSEKKLETYRERKREGGWEAIIPEPNGEIAYF
jgi:hypothetical protein